MITVPDLIKDYRATCEVLDRQIAALAAGGKIYPAGATEGQAITATQQWLGKLRSFRLEYTLIIQDLERQVIRA
jgi:hypothetical protein